MGACILHAIPGCKALAFINEGFVDAGRGVAESERVW
jgi:hypothetical protein